MDERLVKIHAREARTHPTEQSARPADDVSVHDAHRHDGRVERGVAPDGRGLQRGRWHRGLGAGGVRSGADRDSVAPGPVDLSLRASARHRIQPGLRVGGLPGDSADAERLRRDRAAGAPSLGPLPAMAEPPDAQHRPVPPRTTRPSPRRNHLRRGRVDAGVAAVGRSRHRPMGLALGIRRNRPGDGADRRARGFLAQTVGSGAPSDTRAAGRFRPVGQSLADGRSGRPDRCAPVDHPRVAGTWPGHRRFVSAGAGRFSARGDRRWRSSDLGRRRSG